MEAVLAERIAEGEARLKQARRAALAAEIADLKARLADLARARAAGAMHSVRR